MAVIRHLRNAPIRETLIDIAVKLPKEADVQALRPLSIAVAKDYPKSSLLHQAEVELVLMKEGKKLTETQKPMGYLCQTEDQRKIVQFRVNGFSYHWLKPYDTWENFRDAARGLWTSYVDTAKPMAVIRVSLRYINSLELPFPMSDFGTYLTMPPRLPAELPQGVSRFLTRVSIDRNGAAAVITQAFEGLTGTSNVKVLLDIATSKQASFMKEEEIWSALEDLHTFKNEIFFNSVTEEAVRLFE